jgi:hypothetical protein
VFTGLKNISFFKNRVHSSNKLLILKALNLI